MNVVTPGPCLLGEGPVWDAARSTICWVDIENGLIHQYHTRRQLHSTTAVQQLIGSVALTREGDFIAALKSGIGIIQRDTGTIRIISSPECHLPNNRFNDGKCDPAGRFWAGTVSLSEQPQAGNVYMLTHELQVIRKIKQVTIPNGMAWSPDAQTFYFIDSPARTVVAYGYNNETGDIRDKRVVLEIPATAGLPDGMTIDSEGMLWIAHWNGWQVSRWNPHTGEQLHRIELPVANITSCTFGGDNLDDLYITTAAKGLTAEQKQAQPLAGSLFVMPGCGFTGLPASVFYEERVMA